MRAPNHIGILLSLCGIVAVALVGCGSSASHVSDVPKATPTATVTPRPTVVPASTAGWAIYTDKRFHFQIPIPPGWKAKSYTAPWTCPQGGDSDYIVGFFPLDIYHDAPGAIPADYPFGKIHEYMSIYLPLCPSSDELAPNPYHDPPEPGGILIGIARAPYYVHDGADWISRYTNADFGGQTYIFDLNVTPQDKGLRDLPLFHGMLAGFKYLG